MSVVEIYFSDLTEQGQNKILDAQGLNSPEEGNYDMDNVPIVVLEFDDDLTEFDDILINE